jgi:hypothetical protein
MSDNAWMAVVPFTIVPDLFQYDVVLASTWWQQNQDMSHPPITVYMSFKFVTS